MIQDGKAFQESIALQIEPEEAVMIEENNVLQVESEEAVMIEESNVLQVEPEEAVTTTKIKLKMILRIMLLNIVLPTVDVFTDLLMTIKLFTGGYDCSSQGDYEDYDKCLNVTDHDLYCSSNNNPACYRETHPKFGTALLIPFLLSYIACFLTWARLNKNKKKTFIFPLLNIYPQFGKKTSPSLWILEFRF